MEEKKVVLEFDLIEISFILRCLAIGSFSYQLIKEDLVIDKTLERITEKIYKEAYLNDKKS